MNAGLFEMDSWLGHQKYIFKGEDASDILSKFERIRDLSCLVRMGRANEGKKGQKQLDKLEKILEKYYSGDLTMDDLKDFDIKISLGAMKCSDIAIGEDEIEVMKNNNQDATCND